MLRNSNIEIPRKITIFTGGSNRTGSYKQDINQERLTRKRTEANKELMQLIELARALMLFKIDSPKPMNGVFKEICSSISRTLRIKKVFSIFLSPVA